MNQKGEVITKSSKIAKKFNSFFASVTESLDLFKWSYLPSHATNKIQATIDSFSNHSRILKDTATDIQNTVFQKSVFHVIRHAKFQLFRACFDGVIWRKAKSDDKYINKQVQLFTHQTMRVSKATC